MSNTGMHRRRPRPILASVAALALAVSACGGSDTASTTSTSTSAGTSTTGEATTSTTASTAPPSSTTEAPATSDTSDDTPDTSSSETGSIVLEAFSGPEVTAAGYEAIGCWFGPVGGTTSIFFAGFNGGFMMIDGAPITLDGVPGAEDIDYDAVTAYRGQGYDVMLEDIGEPVDTSIESTTRTATLVVAGPDDARIEIEGELGCGV